MKSLGVGRGDRVLIYMPMIAEATFAILACARIGAIHSVVFGGFASGSLATRIDDAKPSLIVSSDAGMRGGKSVPYKALLDEACRLSEFPPAKILIVNRGIEACPYVEGRDVDYAALREQHMDAQVPCEWMESSEPSYILYTSGTTGKPKGVQRDTGGHAVALAASMKYIFTGFAGHDERLDKPESVGQEPNRRSSVVVDESGPNMCNGASFVVIHGTTLPCGLSRERHYTSRVADART